MPGLLLALADARAQPYTHLAPQTTGGTTALGGIAFRGFASVGLAVAGRTENATRNLIMTFGPWPLYARKRQSITDSAAEDAVVPTAFRLEQNYPNPFNPATTIQYHVPEAVHVRLTVYDPLGRLVAVPVDRPQAPGTYTARFDAAGRPSGLYLYRLEAGSFQAAHTMLLLK